MDATMRAVLSLAAVMKMIRDYKERFYGRQPQQAELLKPQAPPVKKEKGNE